MRTAGDTDHPYSVRILTNYLAYVNHTHPEVAPDAVLEAARLSRERLQDADGWLSQDEVDRFNHAVTALCPEHSSVSLPRAAGRHILRATALGPLARHILGVTDATTLYRLYATLAPRVAANISYSVSRQKTGILEVSATLVPGYTDTPYQCQNRIGILEAIPTVLGLPLAAMEHTRCLHSGDDRCVYSVRLPADVPRRWLRWGLSALGVGALGGLVGLALGLPYWATLTACSPAALAAVFFHLSAHARQAHLERILQEQAHLASELERVLHGLQRTAQLSLFLTEQLAHASDMRQLPDRLVERTLDLFDLQGVLLITPLGDDLVASHAGTGLSEAHLSDAEALRDAILSTPPGGAPVSPVPAGMRFRATSLSIDRPGDGVLGVWLRAEDPDDLMHATVEALATHLTGGLGRAMDLVRLRHSQSVVSELLDGAPDLILGVTGEDQIAFMNRAAQRFFGDPLAGGATTTFRSISGVGSAQSARATTEGAPPPEALLMGVSDTPRYTLWHIRALGDCSGSCLAHLCIGVDVGDERALAQRAQEVEERLLQGQKLEALGTLAGGISHDVNNVLMGIQASAELLIDPTTPAGERQELAEEILAGVERASSLTTRLLAFSRHHPIQHVLVDLNAVIRQTLPIFTRTRPDVVVHLSLREPLSPVDGDPRQLEQVFLNLFINAGLAMPQGGELRITTADLPAAGAVPPQVQAAVADTGVGMDGSTLARAFEPFFTTRASGEGTGLGLASAYGTILRHSGTLTADSALGEGSTFTVRLPLSRGVSPTAPEPAPPAATLGGATLLLIDDEEMILRASQRLLERQGYAVLVAQGGAAGVAVLLANPRVEAVILDMVMPGLGGGETFRILRRHRPTLPVLVASGYSRGAEAEAILAQPSTAFLQKPYQREALAGKLAELLSRPTEIRAPTPTARRSPPLVGGPQ
ncbi:MAG: response regulator [Deltaproteobacteria bacterium]|nr:response regulator [Deltaproteobacteria bacterium]